MSYSHQLACRSKITPRCTKAVAKGISTPIKSIVTRKEAAGPCSSQGPATSSVTFFAHRNINCRGTNEPSSASTTVAATSFADGTQGSLSKSDTPSPPPPAGTSSLNASMQTRYEQAYSMSQLYATERPPPIPPSEHERRRRVKDVQEVVDAGRRKRLSDERIWSGLSQLDALLPGVLSLHRMKPSDWATVAADIDGVAEKIILIKSLYPPADIFKIILKKPKLLLMTPERLKQDAADVLRLLSSAPAPAAILEATPDLTDPLSLSRCLAALAASFPGQDPVTLLQQHPDLLANSGSEALVELTADYGELSTKD